MKFSRQECWSGLPFPSPGDHILSDLSTMTCLSWVAPWAWLSFIELDQAVIHVIRLTSFLWLWFQWVCPLATLTVLFGFLLPWTWGISSQMLQQSAATAPYLGQGVCPHRQTLGWKKHKLESRFPGEISITSDMQMTHPYGRKWRGTKKPLDESERGE